MNHVVQLVELKRLPRSVRIGSAYTVDTKRPAVWLQRLCCWVLRKLGAFYWEEHVTETRHVFDSRVFMKRLLKNHKIVREFNREPKTLLIGPKQFEELMHEMHDVGGPFSFNGPYYKDRRVLGCEVKIIPWMDGILVVP